PTVVGPWILTPVPGPGTRSLVRVLKTIVARWQSSAGMFMRPMPDTPVIAVRIMAGLWAFPRVIRQVLRRGQPRHVAAVHGRWGESPAMGSIRLWRRGTHLERA